MYTKPKTTRQKEQMFKTHRNHFIEGMNTFQQYKNNNPEA